MAGKTIDDAVERLPKSVANHIVRMFKATGYIDYCEGNLVTYLKLIERAREQRDDCLSKAEKTLAKISRDAAKHLF